MQKDVARKQEETKGDKIVDDKERKKNRIGSRREQNNRFLLPRLSFGTAKKIGKRQAVKEKAKNLP